jgi:hypothetical protein
VYTQVHENFAEGSRNYRLLFGQRSSRRVVDFRDRYSSRAAFFRPGVRFAPPLWQGSQYGAIRWRCFVREIVKAGEAAESHRVMTNLAGLEGDGTDPINCPTAMCLGAAFRLRDVLADTAPVQVGPKKSLHGMP